jgi:hypothetical protein
MQSQIPEMTQESQTPSHLTCAGTTVGISKESQHAMPICLAMSGLIDPQPISPFSFGCCKSQHSYTIHSQHRN